MKTPTKKGARNTSGGTKGGARPASFLEETLALQIRALKLPEPEREHRFCERLWRFDFAWPTVLVAAECEGGTSGMSRHTTRTGFHRDCQKYNTATELGWSVFRYDAKLITSGYAIQQLERVLKVDSSG